MSSPSSDTRFASSVADPDLYLPADPSTSDTAVLVPLTGTDIDLLLDGLADAEAALAVHGDLLPVVNGTVVLPEDDPDLDTSGYTEVEGDAIDLVRHVRALEARLVATRAAIR